MDGVHGRDRRRPVKFEPLGRPAARGRSGRVGEGHVGAVCLVVRPRRFETRCSRRFPQKPPEAWEVRRGHPDRDTARSDLGCSQLHRERHHGCQPHLHLLDEPAHPLGRNVVEETDPRTRDVQAVRRDDRQVVDAGEPVLHGAELRSHVRRGKDVPGEIGASWSPARPPPEVVLHEVGIGHPDSMPGASHTTRENVPVLTVASVNVNGIRAAYRRGMGEWVASRNPDVLALQEVRAGDEHLAEHLGPGWHVAHERCEVKGRAGVAVASRLPVHAVRVGLGRERDDETSGRWVEVDVELPGGEHLTAASVYVHKGEAGTGRMAAKYAFLDAVTDRLADLADGRLAVVAGDLNIAHRALDLKTWAAKGERAGFLPQERAYLDRWLGDLRWVDVARRLVGDVPGPYTWWSWRGRSYDSDAGWRIDYQLATSRLAAVARRTAVDRAATYAARFSDHAPLVVEYDVAAAQRSDHPG